MPPPTLVDDLFARGYEFDFFQAVRLLEAVRHPDLPVAQDAVDRLGDGIRIGTLPSLSFPASSIYGISPAADGRVPVVTVTFFGLTGTNGVLPTEYTDLLCRLGNDGRLSAAERTALRDWFDLFNHRMAVLLYGGWEKYRFTPQFARHVRLFGEAGVARPGAGPLPDPFTGSLLSFVGMGAPALRHRVRVDQPVPRGEDPLTPLAHVNDTALLHYSGLMARRQPTAAGLRIILSDYFGVDVRVDEMTGQWLALSPSARTTLTPGGTCELGRNAIAGERVWDVSSKFRVVLGPLRYQEFVEFLPDPAPVPARKGFFLLSQVTRLYVGPEFDFEVQLLLMGSEVPDCLIQDVPEGELGVRLGWNTWLPREVAVDAVDEASFEGDTRTVLPVPEGFRLG
jgi:type VI secretion system protein ImpH